MSKKINYSELIKETLILTVALDGLKCAMKIVGDYKKNNIEI